MKKPLALLKCRETTLQWQLDQNNEFYRSGEYTENHDDFQMIEILKYIEDTLHIL